MEVSNIKGKIEGYKYKENEWMKNKAITGQDKKSRLWKEKDRIEKCNSIMFRSEK